VIIVHVTHVALGLHLIAEESFRILEDDQERREEEHLTRNLHGVPFFCGKKRRKRFCVVF
tara:strand:+ start:850 stop:1029 length:180 start_codon:yes stop_codon:yes gene_type:complete